MMDIKHMSLLRLVLMILSISALYINQVKAKEFGKKCSSDSGCRDYFEINGKECEDGYCTCSDPIYLDFNEYSLQPQCNSISQMLKKYCDRANYGNFARVECPANSTCIRFKGCECDEGFVKISSECKKVIYQDALQRCYIKNDVVYGCDLEKHSICKSGKCICFEGFLPNTTSGECVRKEDYLKALKVSEYRVLPGEYCWDESYCREGLECSSYSCQCPSPCTYKKEKLICDCGSAEYSSAPIFVGILFGLLICAFWYYTIKTTIKSYEKKRKAQCRAVPTSEPATAPSYPLASVASSSPTISTNVPSASLNEEAAERDSLPSKPNPFAPEAPSSNLGHQNPTSYPAYPPQAPNYDDDPPPYSPYPPQAPGVPPNLAGPTAPPIGLTMPDASNAPPPPLGVNPPVPAAGVIPPYGSDPYPLNPVTTPYSPPPPYNPNPNSN